jgi:hypothetical protein
MLEILLGIVAIIIALLAIAEVQSTKKEMEEAVKALTAAEEGEKRVLQTVNYALGNKTPNIQEVEQVAKSGTPPYTVARVEQLRARTEAALYNQRTFQEYVQIMLGLKQKANNNEMDPKVAEQKITDMLVALYHKTRAISTAYQRGHA